MRRVLLLEPGAVDIYFLLETVEDMKKKVESLCDVNKQVVAYLSDAIDNLMKHVHSAINAMTRSIHNMKSSILQQQRPYLKKQHAPDNLSALSYAASVGVTSLQVPFGSTRMAADLNLRVTRMSNSYQHYSSNRFSSRQKSIIGSKNVENAAFKASSQPREYHMHLGNLELNTTIDLSKDFVHVLCWFSLV